MKRIAVLVAAVAAAVVLVVPATSSAAVQGGYLSVGAGKGAIKSHVKGTQIGTQFRSQVTACYKPRNDRVKCFWQSVEWTAGAPNWMHCYGTATATDRWGWIDTNLGRGWVEDCFYDYSRHLV